MRALLDTADSLIDRRPDSALAMLDRHESVADSMPTGMQMRYRLLRAKAMNRAFVPFTTDTVMKDVTTWYDRHGNIHERMMAYYLLGCVYRDMGDAPTALVQYNKAVELADTTADDCDWHTLCRIHGQRAELFGRMRAPEYEIKANRWSMLAALRDRDTLTALKAYELQVNAYYSVHNEDSVISITQNVVGEYLRCNRKDLAARALPTLIYVYLNRQQFYKAKKCMDYFESYSGLMDIGGNIREGHELYYDAKAKYYYGVGKFDSAFVYLEKLQMGAKDIMCKEAVYKGLMLFYAKQNQPDSVIKYSKLYCLMNDSAAIVSSAEDINRTQALYDYNHVQQDMMEKIREADNYKLILVCSVFGIILALFILYRLYSIKKRNHDKMLAEKNSKYCGLLTEYENTSGELMKAMYNFEQYRKDKEDELKRIRESIALYRRTTEHIDNSDVEQDVGNNEMVKRLHKMAVRNVCITAKELADIVSFVENTFPEFYDKINNTETKLSEREKFICIMIRLYLIPSEISVILDISIQNLTNTRSKINKKLFKTGGTKSLDHNLRRLS